MKSTTSKPLVCDDLWNERQAHISMQQSKAQAIQDTLKARNAQTILNEQLRKQRLNEAFVNKIRQILTIIAIAIIAYTLIHFA